MKRERGNRNDTRDALLEYIEDNPGVSFPMVQKAFRMNEGTLRYHLDYLAGEDKVRIARKGNVRCYYCEDVKNRSEEMSRDESRIANLIRDNPGISRSELRRIYGPENDGLPSILRKLRDRKMIWKVEDGGDPCYEYITDRQLALEMMTIVIERFLDDEIDRETFLALKRRIEEGL